MVLYTISLLQNLTSIIRGASEPHLHYTWCFRTSPPLYVVLQNLTSIIRGVSEPQPHYTWYFRNHTPIASPPLHGALEPHSHYMVLEPRTSPHYMVLWNLTPIIWC